MEGIVVVLIAAVLAILRPEPQTEIILVDNDKKHNAIVVSTKGGEVVVDKPYMEVSLRDEKKPPSPPKPISKEEVEKEFKDTLKLLPPKPVTLMLYFKNNSTELTDESKEKLEKILDIVKKRMPCLVDVIGHSDTVGDKDKNAVLSLKRAKIVMNMLIKKGIDPSLLRAKGYGENDLVVETADEVSEPKNRSVEIFIK